MWERLRSIAPEKVRGGRNAFTLLEVVIALGVTSFALVAILGLFSVGFNVDKQSNQSTTLATMSLQALAQVRANTNLMANPAGLSTNFYFDSQGNPILSANKTTAYYACQLTSSTSGDVPPPDSIKSQFVAVTMKFTWPVSANLAAPLTTNIYASVAP